MLGRSGVLEGTENKTLQAYAALSWDTGFLICACWDDGKETIIYILARLERPEDDDVCSVCTCDSVFFTAL